MFDASIEYFYFGRTDQLKNLLLNIKQSVKLTLAWLLSNLSSGAADNILKVIRVAKPEFIDSILRQLDPKFLCQLTVSNVKIFNLISPQHLGLCRYEIIKPANWEEISLPSVWGISKGGKLSIWSREVALYKFENAEIQPCSDFVRIRESVYWDKFGRFQLVKTIPLDQDLVHFDSDSQLVYLREMGKFLCVKVGFSLCGVHVNSWGHFIGNFLPKLASLEKLQNESELVVIIPSLVDDHIKEFVSVCIKRFGDYRVLYVGENESVKCEKLFYCSGPSFITDDAYYIHPSDVHLTTWALEQLYKFAALVRAEQDFTKAGKKLYIGRRGTRNMHNFIEIENLFIEKGYEVVFPHKLSFHEKVVLFSEATHVCGPYSSGFANIIFCRPGTKVLALCNYARIQDSFIAAIGAAEFDLEVTMLTGDEFQSSSIHNSFFIHPAKLCEAAESLGFFSREI